MKSSLIERLGAGLAGLALVGTLALVPAHAASERALFISPGGAARAPTGWKEFCAEYAPECDTSEIAARDATLTSQAWNELVRINQWVNDTVKPMTDLEHWGVTERWNYPDDGYGDCEDYVLLKRRMLIQSGWPRETLLVTVVRDKKGEGHAVLTVTTDKGDYILDNQNEDIFLWWKTGYRFVKRQSRPNPNVWVSLGNSRPAIATATSR